MDLGFINNFLDKLKSKSATVAINISSNSTIEVVELDKNGMINNFTSAPIQYNAFTKEIENIANFETEIKKAFSELGVSMASPVYVSLPTYVIDHETLPDSDDREEVKMMLRATVEKNYIFKKYDPAISFYKLPSDSGPGMPVSYCYTALRADEYGKIKGVFESLGINVKAIDSSHSALINGVIATGRISPDIIATNGRWNIINITSNSFVIFAMQGKYLVSVYEEPIAVKSFSEEEVYQIITNSLDLVLENYPAEQLVIVSQSDDVSAEYLSSVLNTSTSKAFIEDNKYRKQLVELSLNITQSNKTKISLETVGIATWHQNEEGFKFNFLDVPVAGIVDGTPLESIFVQVAGRDIELTPELVRKIAIGIFLIIAVILGAFYGVLATIKSAYDMEKSELASKISRMKKELDIKVEITGMSEAEFLQKNYLNNLKYKKSYAAIAQQIPKMLWIEEFQLDEVSKLYLLGRSYRMDDVLNYYDSLKNLGEFPNLRLNVLRISNTPISDLLLDDNSDMFEETTYEFAIGSPFYVDPNRVVAQEEPEIEGFGDPLPPGAFGSDEKKKKTKKRDK